METFISFHTCHMPYGAVLFKWSFCLAGGALVKTEKAIKRSKQITKVSRDRLEVAVLVVLTLILL